MLTKAIGVPDQVSLNAVERVTFPTRYSLDGEELGTYGYTNAFSTLRARTSVRLRRRNSSGSTFAAAAMLPPELMPPKKSNKTLTAEQKELLKRWIEQGAEWEGHWAFVKPAKTSTRPVAARSSSPVSRRI